MKQTAGRKGLGDLAPKFAELKDDVLFGEIWSRTDKLSLRDRCIITVVALVSKGITDNSLIYHLILFLTLVFAFCYQYNISEGVVQEINKSLYISILVFLYWMEDI